MDDPVTASPEAAAATLLAQAARMMSAPGRARYALAMALGLEIEADPGDLSCRVHGKTGSVRVTASPITLASEFPPPAPTRTVEGGI
jgi:energy-converting hydrogenase Eha subunit B